MNHMTKVEYSNAKRRLTKAENKLKRAEGVEAKLHAALDVMREVEDTFSDWDRMDLAYPDDWHRWRRAYDDAQLLYARLERW